VLLHPGYNFTWRLFDQLFLR